jgi:hypothetical protein
MSDNNIPLSSTDLNELKPSKLKNTTVLDKNGLWGHLEVYEFPIQNSYIYKLKHDENKNNDRPSYTDTYLQLESISEIDEYARDGMMRIDTTTCSFSPDLHSSTNLASCDQLQFHYTHADRVVERMANYMPDNKRIYRFIKELKNIFKTDNTPFLTLVAESFDLPEINFEAYFSDKKDKISTLNPNLISSTVLNDFNSTFNLYMNIIEDEVRTGCTKLLKYNNKQLSDYYNVLQKEDLYVYQPVFGVKIKLPKDSVVGCFGDLHSSVHTLLRSLLRLIKMGYLDTDFKMADNFYLIFLGDLVDRGLYGVIVFYIVMKLKVVNKDKVFVCRGNHESYNISALYGFMDEVFCLISARSNCNESQFPKNRWDRANDYFTKIGKSWLYLPSALFMELDNKEFIQFCHGGFYREVDKIQNFLTSDSDSFLVYMNNTFILSKDTDTTSDRSNRYTANINGHDFQWSDYACGSWAHSDQINWGRPNTQRGGIGRSYIAIEAYEYMKKARIVAMIRGHQDLKNNTKLIKYDGRCREPIDWEDEFTKNPELFSQLVAQRGENFSIYLPIPKLDKLGHGFNGFYPSVYTFTSAVSPRMIDSDGFGLLKLINHAQTGGKKYSSYKKNYLRLKKTLL